MKQKARKGICACGKPCEITPRWNSAFFPTLCVETFEEIDLLLGWQEK